MNFELYRKSFDDDGYVIIKNIISKEKLKKIGKKKKNYFNLKYERNIFPDKIKWDYKSKNLKSARSQCNLWKSDKDFARISLSKKLGNIAAQLMRWDGARLNQDSLIWVLPKTGGVIYHQDNPYQDWNTPGKIITCWIPLYDTSTTGGTLEYIVGSHKWKKSSTQKKFFSNDYKSSIKDKFRKNYKIKKMVLKQGDIVFHHGNIWHGSDVNKSVKDRASISIHYMDYTSKFHKKINNPVFSRYKKFQSLEMDENFFPIVWHKKNKISRFIREYLKK